MPVIIVLLTSACPQTATDEDPDGGADDLDGGPPACVADEACIDGGGEPTREPIPLETFEQGLVVEACAGFFRGANVNPDHRSILRIPDEKTCLELLTPVDLEPRWPEFVAALAAGDFTYDGVAAALCLEDVASALGNGYVSWMNAGSCVEVLTGIGADGDACTGDDQCAPGLVCTESICSRAWSNCVDTHQCPNGEWCHGYEGCREFEPKAAEGDRCVVYTDDGYPVDCDVGLTCPMLDYVGHEGDGLHFGATCSAPQAVGERCHRDLDCEFGLRCDRADCPDQEPCPEAICAVP